MDPPQCVQNAMMTKDKKPFTYTPGGIDLSEVRSPRMQRRIERNANLGGASDVPQQPPRPQNVGPLPPATLAAMRPQPQVQVFPGPPPPPPMSKNIPPPPPPPCCPLPTQKVTTSENQVLERPDMTKIIPDNPMAMLRKTGGPAPRKSFVEQMYEEQQKSPPSPPQRGYEAQSPRPQPPVERPAPVSPPVQQQRQPQPYQQQPQQYQPPAPTQQYQPSTPPQNQYQASQQTYPSPYQPVQPPQPSYQAPVVERQPTMGRQDQPQRNVSSSVGSLYIPPINQQQPQKFTSAPSPPEYQPQVQSPGTPTLKEAPRPWQQKTVQQQQEVPPWAKKEDEERSQQPQSAPGQRWAPTGPAPPQATPQQVRQPMGQPQAAPQQVRQPMGQPMGQQFSPRPAATQQPPQRTPPAQNQPHPSNSFPVHIEIRSVPYPQNPEPTDKKPDAVYVTQPVVLQHPGNRIAPPYQGPQKPQQPPQNSYQPPRPQSQPQPRVESSGTRIIPIQIESTPPSTPGAERGLNRQLSWGSQPPQSNSFKVIQRYTKTDDDEDDDTPLTQHSPRYTQEMPEQVRKMKINDNGHFKQGNGQPQPYVHPSEQVVPEPKKYMGSNIPSRSFKILQAMTAPSDSCANATYNEEMPFNPTFNPYGYPYYPPPYWPNYYPNCYPPEQPEPPLNNDHHSAKSGRSTPLPNATSYAPPYWHEYYSNFYPQQQSESFSKMSDKSSNKSGRSTPLPTSIPMPPPMPPPFWGYMPSNMPSNGYIKPQSNSFKSEKSRPQTPKPNEYQYNNTEETVQYPPYHMYPPYYDPYYYSYYYGYPPMMPPYSYYPSSTDVEEYSGYSSQDEMSSYSRRSSLKRRNSLENSSNSVQALRQHYEVRCKSATPRITITPSVSHEKISHYPTQHKNIDKKNFETELQTLEQNPKESDLCGLRSIKSVQNVCIYAEGSETENESSESEVSSEEETEEEEISETRDVDEVIPHQLSVIFEESERGDSRRSFRPSSVASESTTIAEHQSEDEDYEDFLASQNVKFKINMFQETQEISVKSVDNKIVKTFEQEKEIFSTFTNKNQFLKNKAIYKNKESRGNYNIEEYESDNDTVQEDIIINTDLPVRILNDQYDDTKNICQEICNNDNYTDKNTQEKVIKERDKESEGCWWDIIKEKYDSNELDSNHTSINKKEKECDSKNLKAEHVMMGENETEVVCVKLRNKKGRKDINTVTKEFTHNNVTSSEANDLYFEANQTNETSLNRNSIYDILKEDENSETIVSSGSLMKVDSFVSALETIKRNSGLWNYEEINFGNPPIKEETSENNENVILHETTELYQNKNTNLDTENASEESEVDFWSQIKSDDDDFKPRPRSQYFEEEEQDNSNTLDNTIVLDSVDAKESNSASSRHSSFSKSQIVANEYYNEDQPHNYKEFSQTSCSRTNQNYNHTNEESKNSLDDTSDSESSDKEDEKDREKIQLRKSTSRSKSLEPQTIKDRIEALRNSIAQKQKKLEEKEDICVSVKNKIAAIEVPVENRSKTTSTKSSVKSFEEYSEEEEEVDSGVISDISRHISDNEEFPELKKLTRYERAATHSRLFKLLQDECDIEEEEEENEDVFANIEDKFSKLSVRKNREHNKLAPSRSKLSLALNNQNDDGPHINEKLVNELVQSLLRSRKGHVFKSMPQEKLRTAAIIILQEGIEATETPSEDFSSFLTPLRGNTVNSTPAQTPQEFYSDTNEYKQYYDTWGDASLEISSSKAFRMLQEPLGIGKLDTIEGILAKYPKILSNKNISKEILKHLDELSSDYSFPHSQNPPHSNDVTNT